jgi:RNA polymerase sporulation-specific sigma factor
MSLSAIDLSYRSYVSDPDEELRLIERAQSGCEESTVQLLLKYKGAARSIARKYYIPNADRDDILQEAFMAGLEAIRSYTPSKGKKFRCFFHMVVTAKLNSLVRSHYRAKRYKEGLSPIHISSDQLQRDQGSLLFSCKGQHDPVSILIEEESRSIPKLVKTLTTRFDLTNMEQQIVSYWLQGESYSIISTKTGLKHKQIDNAMQRFFAKLRNRLHRSPNITCLDELLGT